MHTLRKYCNNSQRFIDQWGYSVFSFFVRIWVAMIFLNSGLTKFDLLHPSNWSDSFSSTVSLFMDQYQVPVQPMLASILDSILPQSVLSTHSSALFAAQFFAIGAIFGELCFSSLLIIGFWGRLNALGLFMVNLVAVLSYPSELFPEGFEIAKQHYSVFMSQIVGFFYQEEIGRGLYQHIVWGASLLLLSLQGVGKFSADGFKTSLNTWRQRKNTP